MGEFDSSLMPMKIWYHDLYTTGIHSDSRFPRERYAMLKDRIQSSQSSGLIDFISPECATEEDLLLSHDPGFVRRFIDGALEEKEINRIGLKPWTDLFVERVLRIMGGSLSALEHVCEFGGFLVTWQVAPTTHTETLVPVTAYSTTSRCARQMQLNRTGAARGRARP